MLLKSVKISKYTMTVIWSIVAWLKKNVVTLRYGIIGNKLIHLTLKRKCFVVMMVDMMMAVMCVVFLCFMCQASNNYYTFRVRV